MRCGNPRLLVLIFFLFFNLAFAQVGWVKGKVIDSESSQPIPNVNVLVIGTRFGTTTDKNGEFELKLPAGTYEIEARLLGYRSERKSIMVRAGSISFVEFSLEQSYIELEEIEVLADYKAKRAIDVRPSVIDVEPLDVKKSAGVGEDVMRMIQTLPGVSSPADFLSQLVVRGGSPDENLIIVDGVEIYNPYRLYGVVSMFNPDAVSEINFMAGGFPAKYGDRLSAVLDVTNRVGSHEKFFTGMANVNLTNANVIFEGKLPLNGSWIISSRRTYYDLILGPIAKKTGLVSGDVSFPNFYDVQTKISLEPFSGHRLNITGILSRDAMNIIMGKNRPRPDSIAVSDLSYNETVALNWTYSPSKDFVLKALASWYRNYGDSQFGGSIADPSQDFDILPKDEQIFFNIETWSRYAIQKTSFSVEASYNLNTHLIEAGFGDNIIRSELKYYLKMDESLKMILKSFGVFAAPDIFNYIENYHRPYLWVQDRIKVGTKLVVQPSLRFDYYGIISKFYFSPRINLLYNVNPITSLRFAYGLYYQSPGYEKIYDQYIFFDFSQAQGLNAELARHYVAGIERWLSRSVLGRFEVYCKDFDNLIVRKRVNGTKWVADRIPEYPITDIRGWSEPYPVAVNDSVTATPVNKGNGYSYGFEIFVEKKKERKSDKLSGWLSYTYSVAEREIYGVKMPFMFDQRHSASIVLNYEFNKAWELSLTWRYSSNYPYTEPLGLKPRILFVDSVDSDGNVVATKPKIAQIGNKVVLDIDYGGLSNWFNARKPPYHRLDVRLTYKKRFWGIDWGFYLDVINLYNRKNVIGYEFHVSNGEIKKRTITMLPILPTLGISAKF